MQVQGCGVNGKSSWVAVPVGRVLEEMVLELGWGEGEERRS